VPLGGLELDGSGTERGSGKHSRDQARNEFRFPHHVNLSQRGAPPYKDSAGNSKYWGRPLETIRPGIFAAGDVRSGYVKRYAAAVGV
jgi:hypothetical protein